MPDPFESLHLAATTVDPDPTFAARLRRHVERALSLPEGVTVSNLTVESTSAPAAAGHIAAGETTPAVPAAETLPLAYESGLKRLELAATPRVPQSVSKSEEAS